MRVARLQCTQSSTVALRPDGDNSARNPDQEAVSRLIGRRPFTVYSVAVRCPGGGPAVLSNEPVDQTGHPFPTRYWLACRRLRDAVSRLEADGGVRELESDARMHEAVLAANARHCALHAGHNIAGIADPRRVKCLHAHLAFSLAEGGNPVGEWIAQRTPISWPSHGCCATNRHCQ